MKRFLPLFMLTGLLFGQDVLTLKNGESFEGTFHEKLGRDILFKAVGDTTTKKYPIWDIETIVTKNWGELTYPFDIPIDILTKQEYPSKSWSEGYSIGYSSEKIAISFYNLSLLLNIDEHSIKEWLDNIKLLSKCSNVAIKLSGFGEFNSAWTESSIRPLIMNSIESFGTDRCMFGSNFPVDKFLSPAKYEDYWKTYYSVVKDLSSDEKNSLFYINAEKYYKI